MGGCEIMTFIQIFFIAIPLLFLAVIILYAVFKIKEMKGNGCNRNQFAGMRYSNDFARNGLKSTADYDGIRSNLHFPS